MSYPDFTDRIVATSGTAKTYGHGIVRLEGQIAALTADAAFKGGDYTTPPKKGIEAFGMVWAGVAVFAGVVATRVVEDERAAGHDARAVPRRPFERNFLSGADANDLILQARTWEKHDVGTTPGFGGDVETRAARRSRFRSSTCRRRRISTFPSATRATKRSSCRRSRSCRFRRCGVIRPAPAPIPKTARF